MKDAKVEEREEGYLKYMEVFKANKDQLSNPYLIQIGQELKIPFVG